MNTSDIVQIIVAAVTAVLAGLTFWYVRLTSKLLRETELQKRPYVFLNIEFPNGMIRLNLENTGRGVAKNINIKFTKDINWLTMKEGSPSLEKVGWKLGDTIIGKHGIPLLPPGKSLKFYTKATPDFKNENDMVIEFDVIYEDEVGNVAKEHHICDLSYLKGVLFVSFDGRFEEDLLREIKGIHRALSK